MKDLAVKANSAVGKWGEVAVSAKKTVNNVTTMAAHIGGRTDTLVGKLIEDAERISRLMTTINKVVLKIDDGKGTAGMFINDPRLYENIVEASRQMTNLIKDFRQLVELWKKKGVQIKLK